MVFYLRLENAFKERHCSFIMGKSRVVPLKQKTIPLLELMTATVAVRTNRMLLNEIEIHVDHVTCWTDSVAVLRYIQNSTSRFHRQTVKLKKINGLNTKLLLELS